MTLNPFVILSIAISLNCYIIYLSLYSTQKKHEEQENLNFIKERDKYFDNLINGFGMDHRDVDQMYLDIKGYSDLIKHNKELERIIKKHKLWELN